MQNDTKNKATCSREEKMKLRSAKWKWIKSRSDNFREKKLESTHSVKTCALLHFGYLASLLS